MTEVNERDWKEGPGKEERGEEGRRRRMKGI